MKYKLAEFVSSYGMRLVMGESHSKEYTQVSEYAEVEFISLPKEIIVNNKIIAIDTLITLERERALINMSELNKQKQELLALTCD
jgi:hypothetical protein